MRRRNYHEYALWGLGLLALAAIVMQAAGCASDAHVAITPSTARVTDSYSKVTVKVPQTPVVEPPAPAQNTRLVIRIKPCPTTPAGSPPVSSSPAPAVPPPSKPNP